MKKRTILTLAGLNILVWFSWGAYWWYNRPYWEKYSYEPTYSQVISFQLGKGNPNQLADFELKGCAITGVDSHLNEPIKYLYTTVRCTFKYHGKEDVQYVKINFDEYVEGRYLLSHGVEFRNANEQGVLTTEFPIANLTRSNLFTYYWWPKYMVLKDYTTLYCHCSGIACSKSTLGITKYKEKVKCALPPSFFQGSTK